MAPPGRTPRSGPRECVLIALCEALRSPRVPGDFAALARLAASYGAGIGVTAGMIMEVRDLTVGEFAAAVLEERRGTG